MVPSHKVDDEDFGCMSLGRAVQQLRNVNEHMVKICIYEINGHGTAKSAHDIILSMNFLRKEIAQLPNLSSGRNLIASILNPFLIDLCVENKGLLNWGPSGNRSMRLLHWFFEQGCAGEYFRHLLLDGNKKDKLAVLHFILALLGDPMKVSILQWKWLSEVLKLIVQCVRDVPSSNPGNVTKPTRLMSVAADCAIQIVLHVWEQLPHHKHRLEVHCKDLIDALLAWKPENVRMALTLQALNDVRYYILVINAVREHNKHLVDIQDKGGSTTYHVALEAAQDMFYWHWKNCWRNLLSTSKYNRANFGIWLKCISTTNDDESFSVAVRNICLALGKMPEAMFRRVICTQDDIVFNLMEGWIRSNHFQGRMQAMFGAIIERLVCNTPFLSSPVTLSLAYVVLDSRKIVPETVMSLLCRIAARTMSPVAPPVVNRLRTPYTWQCRNTLDFIMSSFRMESHLGCGLVQVLRNILHAEIGALLVHSDAEIRHQACMVLVYCDEARIIPLLVWAVLSGDSEWQSIAELGINYLLKCKPVSTVSCLVDFIRCPSGENAEGDISYWQQAILGHLSRWLKSVDQSHYDGVCKTIALKMFGSPDDEVFILLFKKIAPMMGDCSDVLLKVIAKQMEVQSSVPAPAEYNNGKPRSQFLLFNRLSPLLLMMLIPKPLCYDDLCYDDQRWPACGQSKVHVIIRRIMRVLYKSISNDLEFGEVRRTSAQCIAELPIAYAMHLIISCIHGFVMTRGKNEKLAEEVSRLFPFMDVDVSMIKCNLRVVTLMVYAACFCIGKQQLCLQRWIPILSMLLLNVLGLPLQKNDSSLEKLQLGCIDCLALVVQCHLSGMEFLNIKMCDGVLEPAAPAYTDHKENLALLDFFHEILIKGKSARTGVLSSELCGTTENMRICIANVYLRVIAKAPAQERMRFGYIVLSSLVPQFGTMIGVSTPLKLSLIEIVVRLIVNCRGIPFSAVKEAYVLGFHGIDEDDIEIRTKMTELLAAVVGVYRKLSAVVPRDSLIELYRKLGENEIVECSKVVAEALRKSLDETLSMV